MVRHIAGTHDIITEMPGTSWITKFNAFPHQRRRKKAEERVCCRSYFQLCSQEDKSTRQATREGGFSRHALPEGERERGRERSVCKVKFYDGLSSPHELPPRNLARARTERRIDSYATSFSTPPPIPMPGYVATAATQLLR